MITAIIEESHHKVVHGMLPKSGENVTVRVFGPRTTYSPTPATVNWSALGSTSPADAAAYAEMIFTP
jgi:hypothetical protein